MKQPKFPIVHYKINKQYKEIETKTIIRIDDGRDIYELHHKNIFTDTTEEDLDPETIKGKLAVVYEAMIQYPVVLDFNPPADNQIEPAASLEDLNRIELIKTE
jgi:hypothetical protein